MKQLKWGCWAVVAAGFLYAGRERLAARRLEQRATPPAAGAPAPLVPDDVLDAALGTPPLPGTGAASPTSDGKPAPGATGDAPKAAAPFHWLDVQSNPSVVHEGVGGKARAKHGAGVLIDSSQRRWEIEPRRSTSTAAGAEAPAEYTEYVPAATPPADPAEIGRRKENSMLALKCAGAAAAALLIW